MHPPGIVKNRLCSAGQDFVNAGGHLRTFARASKITADEPCARRSHEGAGHLKRETQQPATLPETPCHHVDTPRAKNSSSAAVGRREGAATPTALEALAVGRKIQFHVRNTSGRPCKVESKNFPGASRAVWTICVELAAPGY